MDNKELNKKILLISPNKTIPKVDSKRIAPPLGLMYIASILEKNGINVKILDTALEGYDNEREEGKKITYGLMDSQITERINQINPNIVGITFPFSSEIRNVYKLCSLIRKINKGIKVVVGGIHPTFTKKFTQTNKDIDVIICGEGEYKFLDFVLNGKVTDNKIVDVNKLPLPARHLVDIEKYIKINKFHSPYSKYKRVMNLATSRGCASECIFCSSSNFFGHKVRGRTPKSVLNEIKMLIKEYNIEEIQFEDDNIAYDKQRFKEILGGLKKLNIGWCLPNGVRVDNIDFELFKLMKESGCYQVTFAVESGNEKIQKFIRKNIQLDRVKSLIDEAKKVDILTHIFFMLGFPNETEEQMDDTVKFAEYLSPDSCSFSIVTPLVGTKLYTIYHPKECVEYFSNSLYDLSNNKISDYVRNLNEKFKNLDERKFYS